MTAKELLRQYRWSLRELETLRRQMEDLDSPWWNRPDPRGEARVHAARSRRRTACREALEQREKALAEQMEAVERTLSAPMPPRTRLVLRQYYCLGMTDREVGEADGFSPRTAGNVRRDWLREQEGRRVQ